MKKKNKTNKQTRKCPYKKRIRRGFKPYIRGICIYFGSRKRGDFLPVEVVASFVPQIIGSLIN